MSRQGPYKPSTPGPFVIDRTVQHHTAPSPPMQPTWTEQPQSSTQVVVIIEHVVSPPPLHIVPSEQPMLTAIVPFKIERPASIYATDSSSAATANTTLRENSTSVTNTIPSVLALETDRASQLPASNFTSNGSNTTDDTVMQSKLCGFPSFCHLRAAESCGDVPLLECGECNMGTAAVFAAAIVFMALLIIVANGFVIWCNVAKKRGFTGGYSRIKASLAVADLLTGLQIFFVSISNFSWTLQATARELDERQLDLRGSPQATVGGIFYLLGFVASLYHLVFLSQRRFTAIRWPILYRSQSGRVINMGLAVVWCLAIFMSVLPTFFSRTYVFTYMPTTFLYNLNLRVVEDNPDLMPMILMFLVVFIVPYVVMSSLTIGSGVIVRSNQKRTDGISQSTESRNIALREIQVYRTLAVMQVGFTVTLVPLVVVIVMGYADALTCDTVSVPFAICFYLSMSNSLVNVLVYGLMDEDFRKALRESLKCGCRKKSIVSGVLQSMQSGHRNRTTRFTASTQANQTT